MHADEVGIDETLVHQILGQQFPDWGERPPQRVEPEYITESTADANLLGGLIHE
jgi:hypothetical protein